MISFFSGFPLSFSLILAIGAQNAFVLKQGLKREFVFVVCTVCAVSDAILITAGIAGFGAIVNAHPEIEVVARYGGAAFLTGYAIKSFYSAWKNEHSLDAAGEHMPSMTAAIATSLAFTWLNPHVYLDTVVLIGSIATNYVHELWYFGAGAVLSSFVFFFSLGYGAKYLRPWFQKPKAWKVLELVIGVVMLSIAAGLVL